MTMPAQPQSAKPTLRMPGSPPLKPPEGSVLPPPVAKPVLQQDNDWAPMASAPQDTGARFMVRALVLSKDGKTREPVKGTETIVRYRQSRQMVGRRWQVALALVEDGGGIKLGFRPSEWKALPIDA